MEGDVADVKRSKFVSFDVDKIYVSLCGLHSQTCRIVDVLPAL